MNFWINLVIVLVTYVGIALGKWPRLSVNRTTLTVIGVGLLLAFGQIPFEKLRDYLDIDTLILLFSMMVVNAHLQLAGFFRVAAHLLFRLTRGPKVFLAVEILLAGVLSALFLNDTICLMLTPLVLSLLLSLGRNPIPYLIALATAANIGSTATLTGNPQNMIIGVSSGIPYAQFAGALTPVALLGLGVVWVVLVLFYPQEFRDKRFPDMQSSQLNILRPQLTKTLLVILAMLVGFLAGVPVALAAFLAACVLFFTRRVDPDKVLAEIDWSLLVFFAALFILTGALEANGITQRLFEALNFQGNLNVLGLTSVSVVLSNLVSNVPAVMLLRPVVAGSAQPVAGWLTLAASSTLAGNLTLLGSVANLIVAEIASRRQVNLSFGEYTRSGVVITFLTLIISVLWLQAMVWR
ncbi:anion transporter [Anaerolinea thermophila]|uniref:Arsenical pump membrane protein n=1 Tax=Anaerolinea thermophila (strain DSM 14523 / JCM 11388 / NBRC 100420 / UNI-1) TaxID=926569 RepID=E8N4I6_ANATU|nr:anion transporter [Anaerolinea thermophila]BAJ63350.1 putative arsenical pump membrane protein [Anaerolinea thermophila UNI-1]